MSKWLFYFIFHTSGFNLPLFLRVLGNQAKLAFSMHLTGNRVNLLTAPFPLTEMSESKDCEAEALSCLIEEHYLSGKPIYGPFSS